MLSNGFRGLVGLAGVLGVLGTASPSMGQTLQEQVKNLQDKMSALAGTVSRLQSETKDISQMRQNIERNTTAIAANTANIDTTTTAIAANTAKLSYVSVETDTLNGLSGPHLIISGANVHIRSGSGATYEAEPSGKGNLIVGYNESPSGLEAGDRGGSHNLVVGPKHMYDSTGGLVAGYGNNLLNDYASVSGGSSNIASGKYASVSGGHTNTASGEAASVSGGYGNTVNGHTASASGGVSNTASGEYSLSP